MNDCNIKLLNMNDWKGIQESQFHLAFGIKNHVIKTPLQAEDLLPHPQLKGTSFFSLPALPQHFVM